MEIVRYALAQLRGGWKRTLAAFLAVFTAVTSFVLLTGNALTERLDTSTVEENFRGSYDVLVRPAGSTSAFEQSEGLVRQAVTSSTYGGISFEQLAAIRAIPGVEVAAPLATVGYVMMNATTTVDVSSALSGTDRRLGFYTITAISRNGHVRKTSVEGYVFTTAQWGQRENARGPLDIEGDTIRRACTETAVTFEVSVIWEPRCGPMAGSMADEFGVVTQVDPTVNHEVVDVRLAYPLLITAIDPAAENALTGLDAAVLEGRALTAEDAARSGPDKWDWPRVPPCSLPSSPPISRSRSQPRGCRPPWWIPSSPRPPTGHAGRSWSTHRQPDRSPPPWLHPSSTRG